MSSDQPNSGYQSVPRLAEQRRAMPPGGEARGYTFRDQDDAVLQFSSASSAVRARR